ncbi:PilN domain-containing protein [Pectobacteriaceae bacterium CE90]|nr:PilN domain-containing protein [Prodigiosinella sp. LS101]WJV54248.1 PilN domain-containing protein [Prodigiosinella sp. LS101]WJV58610.1 PilN domain-containing protein [Pectobacteriaceae bacterium C111]WJY14734.1 PilN domain-containing protein [Pectobacteriaceae bacterium CE90]
MLQVNLLPWRKRHIKWRIWQWLILLLLQIAIALLVMTVVVLIQQRQQDAIGTTLREVQVKQAAYETLYRQTRQAWREMEKYQARLANEEQGRRSNQRYEELLMRLPTFMPDSLWLTALSDTGNALHLSGVSSQYDAIIDFTDALAREPFIQQVVLHQTQRSAQDDTLLSFILRLEWRSHDKQKGERQ